MSSSYFVGGFARDGREINGGEYANHDAALVALEHFENNVPAVTSMSVWEYSDDGSENELEGFAR